MLPRIDAQQRRELTHDRVLIGICADQDLTGLVVFDEPGPSAALDTGKRGVELGLEGGEVLVGGFNRCLFPCISLVPSVIYHTSHKPSTAPPAPLRHPSCSAPSSPRTASD
jgi:hypothetical protein